tara:strand:+ start:1261 stop:2205 length:945 start_codon:yes stop_codon:yes gene_type:complete
MPKSVPKIVRQVQEHKKRKIDYETEKSVSFSQFYQYYQCPHQWYLTYVRKLAPYQASIHALFGTAMHETMQGYLDKMYNVSVKKAQEMNLIEVLDDRLRKNFKREAYRHGSKDFTTSKEIEEFFYQGVDILDFLKRKRADYFSKKGYYLAGIEVPIVYPIRENLFFNGFIDLVIYDEHTEKFTIYDIKTSTSGWGDYAKKDDIKISQLLFYKEFFSKTFDIDPKRIDAQYFIVKRKYPKDSEFPAKPVQIFKPATGKVKRAQAMKRLGGFINDVFNEDGSYNKEKLYTKDPSKWTCGFCPFKKNLHLCGEGIHF